MNPNDINWEQTAGPAEGQQDTDIYEQGAEFTIEDDGMSADQLQYQKPPEEPQAQQQQQQQMPVSIPPAFAALLTPGTCIGFTSQNITPDAASCLTPEEVKLVYHEGYTVEFENVAVEPGNHLIAKYFTQPVPIMGHENEMWNIIDKYEYDAWSPANVGFKTGWSTIDRGFDGGMSSGFVVVGGDSNLGKSGFMSQLAWQLGQNNDNTYVLDFSLDDPMKDKIPRIVGAANMVLLNCVKNPNNYQDNPFMLSRRKTGMAMLRNAVDRYRAYDANFTTFLEEIEEEIQKKIIELEAEGVDKKVVVMIDNMHDLNSRDQSFANDKMKYDFIAQWCSDLAIRYDILVVASAELKKINGTRRPSLDDIREAVKIKYEAKAVLLVYQEVHYKGEGSSIYFNRQGYNNKQPVFEVHFAKNKFGSFKGRTFFEFYPEMARFEEPDKQARQHYASVVYGI